MEIPEITPDAAQKLLGDENVVFIDVRDPGSYQDGHLPGAFHINDHNIDEFVTSFPKDKRYVVYCYHGNSSLGGTAYLLEKGFHQVESMMGGYAEWYKYFPDHIEKK